MREGKQKHLDYIPPPNSVCLLSTLRANISEKGFCKQKRVLPKLTAMITTTGSIFGAYPLFLPVCASRVKTYLKSIRSSYDKDDGLIPGG